jgi:hypothetical protein
MVVLKHINDCRDKKRKNCSFHIISIKSFISVFKPVIPKNVPFYSLNSLKFPFSSLKGRGIAKFTQFCYTFLIMPRNEAQTRFDLIDPALLQRGWTRDHIKVEHSTGTKARQSAEKDGITGEF